MTPLIIASACSHEAVVKALLAHLASDAFFPALAEQAGPGPGAANTQPPAAAAAAAAAGAAGPTGVGEVAAPAASEDAAGKAKARARLSYLNTVTRRGNSALHCAARHPATLRRLLAAGSDPTLVNAEGHTALAIARGKGVAASVRMLQKTMEVGESRRVRLLFKARSLSDAAHAQEALAGGARTRGGEAAAVPARAPEYLQGRLAAEPEAALPAVSVVEAGAAAGGSGGRRKRRRVAGRGGQEGEAVRRAVAAHVAAVGPDGGLKPELFVELLELLVPRYDPARRA